MRRAIAVFALALAAAPAAAADTAPPLVLTAPAKAYAGATVVFAGSAAGLAVDEPVALVAGGVEVARTVVAGDGSFRIAVPRLGAPGPYVARAAGVESAPVTVSLHPQLRTGLAAAAAVGGRLVLGARLAPAAAGTLRVQIFRDGKLARIVSQRAAALRLRLDTGRSARVRAVVTAVPATGWLGAVHIERSMIVSPRLQLGSAGPSVLELERRLSAMRYALRGVDSRFGYDTYEAVLAFQKVHGLARTGRVDGPLWRRLATASAPRPRYGGTHVEVDKPRQVLLEVRSGKVTLVVHVSTGATGNTPIGRWQVYRRVTGWDWVLWYPTYFLRGFAIHGYPEVPAYPASHGCIRVPMWVAPRLFAMNPAGAPIYVYA